MNTIEIMSEHKDQGMNGMGHSMHTAQQNERVGRAGRIARGLRNGLMTAMLLTCATALAATAPGVPTTVTAVAGNAQATVTFKAPTSNGGSAITGYTVTSSPAGGVDSNAGTTGLSHIVTGLTNGTAYTFTVKATNAIGTSAASTASASVTPATVPGIPTIGTATGGNAKATITFTAPASNGGSAITSYTATSTPGSKTGTCTVSPCSVTGLTNGTAYTFAIKATNAKGAGTASAASNSVTPATVPGAPTGITATGGNAQASVAFTAPTSNGGSPITSYKATSTPGSLTGTCTTTPCSVTGLTNGTAYTFKVTATNAAGTGTASAASNSVTPAATVPGAPTGATAVAGNANATVTFTAPASNGGSAITGYSVTSLPAGGVDSNAGTTGLSHVITGLANGTAYTFTVKATNAKGTSAASSVSNSVTPAAAPVISLTSPAANAVAVAPGSFTLTASVSTAGTIAKVEFYRGDSFGAQTLLGTVTAAPYTYNWTNVAAGTYSLTAKATDVLGQATTSAAVNVTSDQAPNVTLTSPAAGAQITAGNSFTFTATASSTTSSISKVDFYANNGTTNTLLGTATTATAGAYSFTWSNVPVGNYSLTVIATDALGITTTSAVTSVTAIANVPPGISLTSPSNGTTVTVPGSFTLTATASSITSSVSKVEFYANNGTTNTLVGTVTATPYSYTWSNVALGSYSITAMATDTLNATTTSTPVSVTVSTGIAQAYYIHADHLDTPRQITDTAGSVVWDWQNLDPFGNNVPNENPSNQGTFSFNLRFTGQYFDKETGLIYNRLRDYDPAAGRYIESDLIGLRGGINTYGYVGGNPLRWADPFGLITDCELSAALDVINGLGSGAPLTRDDITLDPNMGFELFGHRFDGAASTNKITGQITLGTNPDSPQQFGGNVVEKMLGRWLIETLLHEHIHQMESIPGRMEDGLIEGISSLLGERQGFANDVAAAVMSRKGDQMMQKFYNGVKQCEKNKSEEGACGSAR